MPTHDFSCASRTAQCYPRTHAASRLYTRPRCLHAVWGNKRRQLHGLRPHCLYPMSLDAPSRRYTLGERRACRTWSIRCHLFAPHPPGHEHTIISEQRGPGGDIQTRQRESVLFARVGKTTVPATAVWPGRALMCSCRASRASHVVVSFDSLPLAQTTELVALCSDRGFGQVSVLFSKGPPALGSACRPRVAVFCNRLGGFPHAKCCHEQREQFAAARVFLSA